MRAVKPVLVGLLLFLGVLFLYQGLGVDFRILNFEALDRYMLAIGSAIIVLAMLIAQFWHDDGKPRAQT